jgi:hypothetical protein
MKPASSRSTSPCAHAAAPMRIVRAVTDPDAIAAELHAFATIASYKSPGNFGKSLPAMTGRAAPPPFAAWGEENVPPGRSPGTSPGRSS